MTHISGNEGEATKGIGGPSTFLQITHLFSSFLTSCQLWESHTIVKAEFKCRVHAHVKLSGVRL